MGGNSLRGPQEGRCYDGSVRCGLLLLFACGLLLGSCSDEANGPGPGAAGMGGVATGGSTSGGQGGGDGGEGGMATGGGGAGTFMLEAHTSLDGDEILELTTNLPREVITCAQLEGAPCEDADNDGLTDAWEDLVLSRLRPFVRLDEAEQLVNDDAYVLGVVGRVTPVGAYVHAYMMLGYEYDFGSCLLTSHNGDSERVALELEPTGDGDVRVRQAYTAAHEGTVTDHSMVFGPTELGDLVHEADPAFGEPRWVVFSSADKHATYATIAICESINPGIPCADEDCAPDNVADPAPFTRLFPYVNAGEPDTPLVTDLAGFGFPGDDAWDEQNFCGGLGGNGCSSPVREKLVTNPF